MDEFSRPFLEARVGFRSRAGERGAALARDGLSRERNDRTARKNGEFGAKAAATGLLDYASNRRVGRYVAAAFTLKLGSRVIVIDKGRAEHPTISETAGG